MKAINPYTFLGEKHKAALDYIIANLPPSPTFDNLNEQLVNAFYIPDPLNPQLFDNLVPAAKTILPNAYNGYVNGTVSGEWRVESGNTKYTESQLVIINQLMQNINSVPVEALGEYLSRMEEKVVSSGLSYPEQTPLLIALSVGKASSEYWMAQITVAAAWVNYLNADTAINYRLYTGWVAAAMQASLLTYGLFQPPQIILADWYSSTIASAGLSAGKVIWGWVQLG